jgi:hypothetical protein
MRILLHRIGYETQFWPVSGTLDEPLTGLKVASESITAIPDVTRFWGWGRVGHDPTARRDLTFRFLSKSASGCCNSRYPELAGDRCALAVANFQLWSLAMRPSLIWDSTETGGALQHSRKPVLAWFGSVPFYLGGTCNGISSVPAIPLSRSYTAVTRWMTPAVGTSMFR